MKHFLEQCLASVQKAVATVQAEVLVVDNASTDGSLDYLKPRYPAVQFIANTANSGFASANNQALTLAKGRYILFLNPDTIIPEDALTNCLAFFEQHPHCGALGVRMVDGSGQFLKESKRAFPSPVTSFYKLAGLARLFPRSAVFSKYHLGHLNEHDTHEVDVLAGAFMMIPKAVLDAHGSFDETFFMYGEDVDLSYRIQKAGFKNYYYPGVSIIHFKGESTRRGSLNYVKMFYSAMSVFVKKHYGQARAGLFNLFIQTAIWLRAAVSGLARFIKRLGLPLIDAGLILLCIWAAKRFWYAYVRTDVRYVREVLIGAATVYTVLYVLVSFFNGLYDRPYRQSNLNRSALAATVVLLALYGLLPEQYRFSRGIILLSAILIFFTLSLLRWLLLRGGVLEGAREADAEKQTVVAGNPDEYRQVQAIYTAAGLQEQLLGRVEPAPQPTPGAIATLGGLPQLEAATGLKEIIFCAGQLSFAHIIAAVQQQPPRFKIRFFAAGTGSIVGSDSKDTAGASLSALGHLRLAQPAARRCKRMVDAGLALLLLLLCPLLVWFAKNKAAYFTSAVAVLLARKTWVGYACANHHLPPLRPGVLASNGWPHAANTGLAPEVLQQIDLRYARQYRCREDVMMVVRGLGRG